MNNLKQLLFVVFAAVFLGAIQTSPLIAQQNVSISSNPGTLIESNEQLGTLTFSLSQDPGPDSLRVPISVSVSDGSSKPLARFKVTSFNPEEDLQGATLAEQPDPQTLNELILIINEQEATLELTVSDDTFDSGPLDVTFTIQEEEGDGFDVPDGEGFASFTIIEEGANLQIIHNSADPTADEVDIYLDSDLIADDFAFRTASEFLKVPAGSPIDIGVAPSNSSDVDDSIFNLDTTLTANENYIAVANGVLDPSNFDASVNTIDFNLDVFSGAQQSSTNSGETSVLVHHGSADAPTVDIRETSVPAGIIVDDISYTEFQGYLDLTTQDYIIDVETGDNSAVVESYEAPLQSFGLTDAAVTVVASGFLDPSANQDGEAFGLFAALPNGGDLVELPIEEKTANLQIIHNAPDPAVDTVDIFVNGNEFLSDVAFREATAFTEVDAGVDLDIQIAPDDAGIENAVGPFTLNLSDDDTVVVVANGVVDPNDFSGAAAFSLDEFTSAKTAADDNSKVEVNVHHGSPDAPNVDIFTNQTGDNPAITDLVYPDFTGYLPLSPENETVRIAETNGTGEFEFNAPLASLSGQAITVLASGFFDEANATDANGFGLLAVLPNGTTIPLDGERTATDGPEDGFASEVPENFQLNQNFPNPFNPSTTLQYALPEAAEVQITLFDMLGRQVSVLVNERKSAGSHSLSLDMSNFSSGVYLYRMDAGSQSFTRKLTLIK